MNTIIECEYTRLISVLQAHLKGEINLAKLKYMLIYRCFMQSKDN